MDFGATLLWAVVVIAVAPIVVDLLPIPKLPVLVVELLLGMVFGPHLLGLISHPEELDALREFGVIFLFFVAGFEVDVAGVLGRPIRKAVVAWGGSVVLAMLVAFGMQQAGLITHYHLVGIAFATTALGPLMPMMSDQKLLGTPFGHHVIGIGTVGEFGPVLLIAFLLNQSHGGEATAGLIFLFLLVCFLTLRNLQRVVNEGRSNRLMRIAFGTFESSAQFAVRMSLMVLVFLVYVAFRFDLDVLLGAFAAGFVIGQMGEVVSSSGASKFMDRLQSKLESIGYGVFIPMFFVLTGAGLDINSMSQSGRAWLILPLVVVGSLLIRGLPTLVVYHDLKRRMRFRLAMMAATQLPLVATLMARYSGRGYIGDDIAAAIVLGCVVTVAVFPLLAFRKLYPVEAKNADPASKKNGNGQTARANLPN